jgi:hypothetical protein
MHQIQLAAVTNQPTSLISSRACLNGQSGSLHCPVCTNVRQTGMRSLSYWCKKLHASPRMHRPRSQ